MDLEHLRAEALRVYQRYAIEVVEELSLCPWARRARLDGRVQPTVVLESELAPERVLPHIDAIAAHSELDIGLLIFPLLEVSANQFRRFVAEVRAIDTPRHAVGETPLFMADFHPEARLDLGSPGRLVSFIRRTPDPTIQLVRRTVLDSVKRPDAQGTVFMSATLLEPGWDPARLPAPPAIPLHQRIAEANYATVHEYGAERMLALLDEIRSDRNQAYAALSERGSTAHSVSIVASS